MRKSLKKWRFFVWTSQFSGPYSTALNSSSLASIGKVTWFTHLDQEVSLIGVGYYKTKRSYQEFGEMLAKEESWNTKHYILFFFFNEALKSKRFIYFYDLSRDKNDIVSYFHLFVPYASFLCLFSLHVFFWSNFSFGLVMVRWVISNFFVLSISSSSTYDN